MSAQRLTVAQLDALELQWKRRANAPEFRRCGALAYCNALRAARHSGPLCASCAEKENALTFYERVLQKGSSRT